MCAHNPPTPALPTHPPTMHLLASSHVDVTHGIRHRVRGRCARHTRTFHTSHTDSENGPRAEALFSAATPPGRMDTSSMTAHKAWSHFVDAAMMRWFSSRAPPKIDRGSHDVLCVREAWHGGRIPLPSTSTMRNGGWIHVRGLFCAAWWKRVCNHANICPYRSLPCVASACTARADQIRSV